MSNPNFIKPPSPEKPITPNIGDAWWLVALAGTVGSGYFIDKEPAIALFTFFGSWATSIYLYSISSARNSLSN